MSTLTRTARLVEQFSRNIREGVWSVDQIIPTEMELMERYQVSRTTIRAALRQLEEKRWVKATPRVGRSVTAEALSQRGTLGLLIRDQEVQAGQSQRFVHAAREAAEELGYQLALVRIDYEHQSLIDDTAPQGQSADLSHFEGLLVLAKQYHPTDMLRLASQTPTVAVMTHNVSACGVPSFCADYLAHTLEAVCHLADLGHRHIALVLSKQFAPVAFHADIRRGFQIACRLRGLPMNEENLFHWQDDTDRGPALYRSWTERHPRPTAILSYLESPLRQLHQELTGHHTPAAERPSLICLADLSNRPEGRAHLSFFHVDFEQMARDAVADLHRRRTTPATETTAHDPAVSRIYPGTLQHPDASRVGASCVPANAFSLS